MMRTSKELKMNSQIGRKSICIGSKQNVKFNKPKNSKNKRNSENETRRGNERVVLKANHSN